MNYTEILLLALALSVDACVVSFSYGLCFKENRGLNSLLLALFTGVFQGIMPCFGYFLCDLTKEILSPYGKWIIFIIFMFLGIKFIKESFIKDKKMPECISIACLFTVGVATSIDAFSAGISLLLYGNSLLIPAIIIALVTFFNSIIGFFAGGRLKMFPSQSLEITAGAILIFLGIKAVL